MALAKALQIVLKAAKLFPVVVEIVGDIEEARSAESDGGKKVTAKETASLIAEGVVKFGKAIAGVFGAEA